MAGLRKNTASQNIYFALINATTGAALTGATVASKVSKDGAAQASGSGTVTEDGNGQYHYTPAQAETNSSATGFLFTATNAIPVSIHFFTDVVDSNGFASVNTSDFGGTAVTGRDIGASVLLSPGTGTGQISITSGALTVGTNNDKTGYSLTQTFPTNFSSLAITAGGLISINAASALTESYAALHATPTLAQLLFEVRALLAENSITGTTMTTNKIDGTTAAHTYTLNSSTAPTALTTAS